MKRLNLRFWIPTALFALAMLANGIANLTGAAPIAESMEHLGYPAYLAGLLGGWKVLGAIALVIPGMDRLKEWAYAGFAFDLTGAAFSHGAVGDGMAEVITPLVLLAIGAVSWFMRTKSKPQEKLEPASALAWSR